MEKFVILRSRALPAAGFGSLSRAAVAEAQMMLETSWASVSDVRDLARDPQVRAFAPLMPARLHKPLPASEEAPAADGLAWGVRAVGAHKSPYTGAGITVAVLDTGIDSSHPAFAGQHIAERDFTGTGSGDSHGHGTHCAGIICGKPVAKLRFGIATHLSRLLVGKVLDAQGRGSTEFIAGALQWAMDEGAHVISMSLGMDFPGFVRELVQTRDFPIELATSKALEAYRANVELFGAIAELAQKRAEFFQATLIVAASGNESDRSHGGGERVITASPPASAQGITAVGAVEESPGGYAVASFSNTNVDLCAPGVGITSARCGGELVAMSGTSMAAPHAAGVAALWAEKLLTQTGRINVAALAARLLASGEQSRLVAPIDHAAVGTGLVQAPLS